MQTRLKLCALPVILLVLATATLASAQRFVRAPIYSAGSAPAAAVTSGDFNGDGNTDLAFVSNTTPAVVTIRLGTGDGKFNKGQTITLSDLGNGILAGDWNADGLLDLAVSLYSAEQVSIMLGNGDGTFTVTGSINVGTRPGLLANGDLNGDGRTRHSRTSLNAA